MTRPAFRWLLALIVVVCSSPLAAQAPPRALTEALRAVYDMDRYTAFDWIGGRYDRGTLTLEGFASRADIKQQAEEVVKDVAGVDTVINEIETLPTHQSDDSLRVRAYVAIYSHPALQMYSPGGGGLDNGMSRREIETVGRFGLDSSTQFRGPHPIHIIVSGGRIQLYGTVGSAQDRQIAEVQVRSLAGSLGVINRIRVRGEP